MVIFMNKLTKYNSKRNFNKTKETEKWLRVKKRSGVIFA